MKVVRSKFGKKLFFSEAMLLYGAANYLIFFFFFPVSLEGFCTVALGGVFLYYYEHIQCRLF